MGLFLDLAPDCPGPGRGLLGMLFTLAKGGGFSLVMPQNSWDS